jgi:nucleoside-diphosphate-sugar epimerase
LALTSASALGPYLGYHRVAATIDSHTPMQDAVHLVLGGAGFIGSHVALALRQQGARVLVCDKQPCAFVPEADLCDRFLVADLTSPTATAHVFRAAAREAAGTPRALWVYNFACDMGGMGYIASNESELMLVNTAISRNVVEAALAHGATHLLFASSACVYPVGLQGTTMAAEAGPPRALQEGDAWPADPQDGYGLEKLYAEELALRCRGASLSVRIVRFHNVYGPRGSWVGGREKAPAAFLRKALLLRELDGAAASHGEALQVWGDGTQARTFCYIADAVRGVLAAMCSPATTDLGPVNIGSAEVVSVRQLALAAAAAVGLPHPEGRLRMVPGPLGVPGRNADLAYAAKALGWAPQVDLATGLALTAQWLEQEVGRVRDACPQGWVGFLREGLTSPHAHRCPLVRFALLVPVTSRTLGRGVVEGVNRLLDSLGRTMGPGWGGAGGRDGGGSGSGSGSGPPPCTWQLDLHFGVDAGDEVCDPAQPGAVDWAECVRARLPLQWALGAVTARVTTFSLGPGAVCRIWADLASQAFDSGATLAVLLGDDVVLDSPGWADAVWAAFHAVAADTGLPLGFACVAFADDCFPGFPTFPVLHRVHREVFPDIIPAAFVNQVGCRSSV